MAKEKQTTKRLTFTEDETEQAILAAAEARVAAGDFPAFNELCKAALQAFLSPAAEVGTAQLSRQVEQLTQAIIDMRAGQENFAASIQTLTTQVETGAAASQATPVPPPLGESIQALHAEVRQLNSNLAAAFVHPRALAASINDAQQSVTTPAPQVDNMMVSEATVGRLARFLEDF